MTTPDSFERDKIITTTKAMVREASREGVTFEGVGTRAGVSVDTVAYFFDSIKQLIAEAQLANYADLVSAHHFAMTKVETALAEEDLDAFLAAVEQNLDLAWTSGQIGNRWGIIELLHDIWGDPFVQSHFCELLDVQFQAWINIVRSAQGLGWIDLDVDAKSLVSVFWSSSVGQFITSGSELLNLTPQENRDFIMRIVRPPSRQATV
ncbi:MAG: TetR/AcrR family transcriptional regulator [Acidimicrobiales bacterium]